MRQLKIVADEYLRAYADKGVSEIVRLIMANEHGYADYNKESLRQQVSRRKSILTKKEANKPVKAFYVVPSMEDILKAVKPESYNPFDLPLPEDDKAKVFQLPVACNNILFLSDIHVPFHDVLALTTALKYGVDRNVNTIYLNGDIMDFYTLSRFVKDKKLRNLPNELEQGRKFLEVLRKLYPNAHIYYKVGNHDVRWDLHIKNNAGDFEGMEEFGLPAMLHFSKHGIQLIESTTIAHIGKLIALHGHELYGTGGVNPARALWMKVNCSAIMSHVHRTSEHSAVNIKDDMFTCWSTGCLGTLRPNYNPNSSYNHGFAWIETNPNGDFKVANNRILNGKIL